ncbi:hydroxyacid dehydrogenase [Candidatus Micrarchaeota archaeon]|nr:hydroxyacid dehydrogenase [Candidatus Micrarchaeota archaeon]
MTRIIISDEMENEVVERIKQLGEVVYLPANLNEAIANADVLIVRSKTKVTAELLAHAHKLKIVARGGVGLDNVDVKACEARHINVLNTPGASANAVAELVLGHMFSCFRNIAKAHHQMKNKIWDKKSLTGQEIEGKTLGVIGYGRIGALVGKKASALGMKIISYNPPPRYEDEIVRFVGLDELLAHADVITLHVPSTPETKNMINSSTIAKMKKGVFIINTARGDIIDENALYEGCKSGKIAAAALDVFPQEPYTGKLLELDNVFFTPHLGAATKEAQGRIGDELVKLLKEAV